MEIKIKNRFNGDTIFSFNCENNTFKKTVEEAVKQKINLNCADFSNTDLRGINLAGIDLRYSNFNGANLQWADLTGVNLCQAELNYANLRGTKLNNANIGTSILKLSDLSFSNLDGAYLCYANLTSAKFEETRITNANLIGANLQYSQIISSDLSNSNLRDANVSGADFHNTNLSGVNFCRTILSNAVLRGAKNVPILPLGIPEGEIVVWKKVFDKIVKLQLLKNSKRLRATTDKCRCDKALALAIENLNGSDSGLKEIVNCNFRGKTNYKIGEIVYPDFFDENRWVECTHGIHFFLDRQKAVDYIL